MCSRTHTTRIVMQQLSDSLVYVNQGGKAYLQQERNQPSSNTSSTVPAYRGFIWAEETRWPGLISSCAEVLLRGEDMTFRFTTRALEKAGNGIANGNKVGHRLFGVLFVFEKLPVCPCHGPVPDFSARGRSRLRSLVLLAVKTSSVGDTNAFHRIQDCHHS